MDKVRCCRFHNILTAVLVLSVFGLAGHFFLDLIHVLRQQASGARWQIEDSYDFNAQEAGHLSDLHGGYILAEKPVLSQPRAPYSRSVLAFPNEVAWQPSTPLRPPITL